MRNTTCLISLFAGLLCWSACKVESAASSSQFVLHNRRNAQPRRPSEEDLQGLEDRIGYKFKDRQLLLLALTHPSYSAYNNLRLHFLGSHALDLAVATYIFGEKKDGQDLDISDMDHKIKLGVSEDNCCGAAQLLKLPELLMVDASVKKLSPKVLAAAFKALIGVVFWDGKGANLNATMNTCQRSGILKTPSARAD